jgi:hypothetical protein
MFRHALIVSLVALVAPLVTASGQDEKPATAKMAGSWDFSFTSPQGNHNWRVKFDQKGDTLSGQAESELGALTLQDAWITGNELSFGVAISMNGQTFNLYFAGLVKGDTADGSLEVPNSGMQPIPFRAVRVAANEESGGDTAPFRLAPLAEPARSGLWTKSGG